MVLASVLVVDDDVAALASARAVLRGAGYAVTEALNGRRALQRIAANPPDLLITEIIMPDVDGIELITAAKRAHPDLPVIVLSGQRFLGGLDLFDLARKLGAEAHLSKPLDAARLLSTVAVMLDPAASG
jgi:CheY-like chemotaxis protein